MDTKKKIDNLYKSVSRDPKMFTKADVYREIAKELNSIGDGSWTYPYIANLHSGKQLDSMSDKLIYSINKAHAKLKPPKPKPLPHEVAKRTLVIHATVPELHEIQERLKDPRERTERLQDKIAISNPPINSR